MPSSQRTVSDCLQPHSESESIDSDSDYSIDSGLSSDAEQNDRDIEEDKTVRHDAANSKTTKPSDSSPPRLKKRPYTFRKRVSNPREEADMRKRWKCHTDELISNIKEMKCCKKLECFKNSNVPFLQGKMNQFRVMSYNSRRMALLEMKGSNGGFFFDGKQVCYVFLKKAFRFSADTISSVKLNKSCAPQMDSYCAPDQSQTTSNSDRSKVGLDAIIGCLERLAESSGDKMPDSEEIHLPFFRKRDVYGYFVDEFKLLYTDSIKVPTKSYFHRTWKRHCWNIKVRRLGRFAKCSICEKLRKGIHDATAKRDYKTLAILRQQKAEHNELIGRERREYKKKRDKARLQPTQYLSIIVDGADQSPFGLPHFMIKTKDDRGHTLKVRLIGLLEHNQQNRLRLFTLTEEYPTGANHVIEAIHRFLGERVNQATLPRTFYLQVDNCTRENKNRYFFAYIESLLRWKLFDEIIVSFLPVGHTHEDIDQTFSRTSDRLRCNDAVTLDELHGEFRQVYNEHTSVGSMNNVINWSDLCENEKCLSNMKKFSKYRYFKFVRVPESDNLSCMVKVNVTEQWVDIKVLSPKASISSFTRFAPNLRNTPPLKIQCPDGKSKVTECIEAAESRIPDTSKVDSLIKLRDKVFNERVEQFHWNLETCVELNLSGLVREEDIPSDEDADEIQPALQPVQDELVNDNYRYELNTFVAVKADDGSDCSFWIAKVNGVHHNSEGVVYRLTVHWFDTAKEKEIFNARYFPSYNNMKEKKSTKRSPMKDEVSVDSVIINFPSLTKQNRLPAAVSQHLRSI